MKVQGFIIDYRCGHVWVYPPHPFGIASEVEEEQCERCDCWP